MNILEVNFFSNNRGAFSMDRFGKSWWKHIDGMVIFYLTYRNRCNLKKAHNVQRIYARRLHIEYTTRAFASI